MLVLNKADLEPEWRLDDNAVATAFAGSAGVMRASAKTGQGVEDAFASLTRAMLAG